MRGSMHIVLCRRGGLCNCQPVSLQPLQIVQLTPDQHAPLAAVYMPACPAEAADPILLGLSLKACHNNHSAERCCAGMAWCTQVLAGWCGGTAALWMNPW